jgi:hypothetical protein
MSLFKPRDIIITAVLLIYVVGAFLTYGYLKVVDQRGTAMSGVCAVIWPFYWPCRGVGAAFSGLATASEDLFRSDTTVK